MTLSYFNIIKLSHFTTLPLLNYDSVLHNHYWTKPLYFLTTIKQYLFSIIQLYHFTTLAIPHNQYKNVPLYHQTAIPLCIYKTVPFYHYMDIPLYDYTTMPLYHNVSKPPNNIQLYQFTILLL